MLLYRCLISIEVLSAQCSVHLSTVKLFSWLLVLCLVPPHLLWPAGWLELQGAYICQMFFFCMNASSIADMVLNVANSSWECNVGTLLLPLPTSVPTTFPRTPLIS
jgi:hypothetical protein